MTKIKISPSLTGTPLTEQELKSIIGGNVNYSNTCYCMYTVNEVENGELVPKPASAEVSVTDENDCISKCNAFCNDPKNTECRYSYRAYA